MLGAFHHGLVASSIIVGGTWKVKSGSYVGTGASLGITGLGFRPQFLIIKAIGSTANDDPVFAWSGMNQNGGGTPAATVVSPNTVPVTGIITSYDADGFTVANQVNVNTAGQTYYYFAIAGSGNELAVGNYVGNSTDNRDVISGLTFQPQAVFIRRRNLTTFGTVWKTEAMDVDSFQLGTLSNLTANIIQQMNSDGAQVGTSGAVNTSGAQYDWIAWRAPSGYAYYSAYTGNGIDNSDMVTGMTFQPTMVMLKGSTNQESIIRGLVHSGDQTTRLSNSQANNVNRIQQFNPDGFQVGNAPDVNSATTIYHFMALKST